MERTYTLGSRRRQVRYLRWPHCERERAFCEEHRIPRLLLVGAGQRPPRISDAFEDWVRLPADDEEVAVRSQIVAERREVFDRPSLREGTVVYRGQGATLSPIQAELAGRLVDSFGDLVLRRDLLTRLPRASSNRNVLDLHMARLRRKLEPVGLSLRAVWGCGYVLEHADGFMLEGQPL